MVPDHAQSNQTLASDHGTDSELVFPLDHMCLALPQLVYTWLVHSCKIHTDTLLKRQEYSLRQLFLNTYISLIICWWWQLNLPELVTLVHTSSACSCVSWRSWHLQSHFSLVCFAGGMEGMVPSKLMAQLLLQMIPNQSEWEKHTSRCLNSHHSSHHSFSLKQVRGGPVEIPDFQQGDIR